MPDDTALPPLPEYAGQVRDAADSLMDTGGEPSLLGSEIRAEVVEAFHRAGNSALLAACSVVGEARQRRSVGVFYQRAPYDLQERRVAEFIARQTGIGAGMDPVGFLIASNAFMAGERKQIMRPPLPAWLLGGWHARGPCISRESPAADRRRGCGGDCDCGGRGSGWSALAEQPQGPAEFRPLRLRVPEAPLPARPPNPNPRGFPVPGVRNAIEAARDLQMPGGVTVGMALAGMREWDAAHAEGERQWPNMPGRVFGAMRDAARSPNSGIPHGDRA